MVLRDKSTKIWDAAGWVSHMSGWNNIYVELSSKTGLSSVDSNQTWCCKWEEEVLVLNSVMKQQQTGFEKLISMCLNLIQCSQEVNHNQSLLRLLGRVHTTGVSGWFNPKCSSRLKRYAKHWNKDVSSF